MVLEAPHMGLREGFWHARSLVLAGEQHGVPVGGFKLRNVMCYMPPNTVLLAAAWRAGAGSASRGPPCSGGSPPAQ